MTHPTPSPSPCDPDLLESYLSDSLPPEARESVERHLDQCVDCQRTLESRAAGDSFWRAAGSLLDTRRDPGWATEPNSSLEITFSSPHKIPGIPAGRDNFAAETSLAHLRNWLGPTEQDSGLGRIDQYDVGELIGVGGMGLVLSAHDGELNRQVAIKTLRPFLVTDPPSVERFSTEARTAASLNHPHALAVFQVGKWKGVPYLVMPMIAGGTLREYGRDHRIPLVDSINVARQIALGLADAHRQGIIHRDIKPSNILLLDRLDHILIADFGLARVIDGESATLTGAIQGTPQFMSPRGARGEPVNAQGDLFSLGGLMYWMATGQSPFDAENHLAVLAKVSRCEYRPASQLNSDLPAWFDRLMAGLLVDVPSKPFDDARELASLLGQIQQHLQNPESTPLPDPLSADVSPEEPPFVVPPPPVVEVRQPRRGVPIAILFATIASLFVIGTFAVTGLYRALIPTTAQLPARDAPVAPTESSPTQSAEFSARELPVSQSPATGISASGIPAPKIPAPESPTPEFPTPEFPTPESPTPESPTLESERPQPEPADAPVPKSAPAAASVPNKSPPHTAVERPSVPPPSVRTAISPPPDWSPAIEIDWPSVPTPLPTAGGRWDVPASRWKPAPIPKPASLLPKTSFHERIEPLVSNPASRRAAVGFTLSFAVDTPQTRLSLIDLDTGEVNHTDPINAIMRPLALLDDGNSLIMVGSERLSDGDNANSNIELWTINGKSVVRSGAWNPFQGEPTISRSPAAITRATALGNRLVAVGNEMGHVAIIDVDDRRVRWHMRLKYHQSNFDLSLDRERLAIFDRGSLTVIASRSGEVLGSIAAPPETKATWCQLAWGTSDDEILVTSTSNLMVLDVAEGTWRYQTGPTSGNWATRAAHLVAPDFALMDRRRLVHLPTRIPVCDYGSLETIGRYHQHLLVAHHDSSGGVIAPIQIPHPAATEVLQQAIADPTSFLVHPGVAIALDVTEVESQYRETIERGLRRSAAASGYEVRVDAPITLKASIEGPQQRAVQYIARGAYIGREYISRIGIEWNQRTLWKSQSSNIPTFLQRRPGQSIQQALDEAGESPNLEWYSGLKMPSYIAQPTSDSGRSPSATGALMSTRSTIGGWSDGS